MLVIAIILFLVAAFFGLFVLSAILKDKKTPKGMVLAHGIFAFIALLVTIAYIAGGHVDTLLITSISLLILAALGGFTLLTIDIYKKPIPKMFAVMHPVFAITGVILLIVYMLQQLNQ